MLLSMRAGTEASRALVYCAAAAIDAARLAPNDAAAQRRADLLIPVVKGWCTDLAVEIASTGIQVHGGMGYVEETGAAQHLRDARILPIYEGTNGIQANDLVGRKLGRDQGEAARGLITEMRATAHDIGVSPLANRLNAAIDALGRATEYLVTADAPLAAAGSAPYLALFGTVAGGWMLARQVLTIGESDGAAAKRAIASFYAEHYLARAPSLLPAIMAGATVTEFDPDWL
jgi:hypothetical protein